MKKILALPTLLFCSYHALAFCQTGNVYNDIVCVKKQNVSIKNELSKQYNFLENQLQTDGKASLLKSQKAWVVYRDEQCNVLGVVSSQAQGAGSELAHISCIADMNKKRLAEIKETIKEVFGE